MNQPRVRNLRARHVLAACVVAALAGGAIAALGASGSGASDPVAAHFGAFRRAANAGDRIVALRSDPQAQSNAQSISRTSRLISAAGSQRLYAFRENGDVCVMLQFTAAPQHEAIGCGHEADAVQYGVGVAVAAEPRIGQPAAVAVLVPDDVHAMSVTRADGTSQSLTPSDNGVLATGADLAETVFTAGNGTRVTTRVPPAGGPRRTPAAP